VDHERVSVIGALYLIGARRWFQFQRAKSHFLTLTVSPDLSLALKIRRNDASHFERTGARPRK
jgi:hypothetical protein